MIGKMKLERSLILGLLVAMLFSSLAAFGSDCAAIREEVLRLHILANSDSDRDQQLKLLVRDELLAVYSDELSSSATLREAEDWAGEHLAEIENTANAVLQREGSTDIARAEMVRMYFQTRTYSDHVILPAGEYDALRITIGEAQGKNWWCVMYPPVCIPTASASTFEQTEQITELSEPPNYRLSFWVVEATEGALRQLRSWFD